MQKNTYPEYALAALLCLSGSMNTVSANEPAPDQTVAAIEGAFGVTPGERRNHIKGTCALGEFVGAPEAATHPFRLVLQQAGAGDCPFFTRWR
jgi:catalase